MEVSFNQGWPMLIGELDQVQHVVYFSKVISGLEGNVKFYVHLCVCVFDGLCLYVCA